MKVTFKDTALAELFEHGKTKKAQYKQISKNKKLVEGFKRAVSIMYSIDSITQLKTFSFLHYERLKYQKDVPRSSVRLVNGMIERLIFTEAPNGIEVELIEINANHYGNK